MKKNLIIILGLVLLGLSSCEYNRIEPEVFVPEPTEDPISFVNQVEPLFQAKCATCHASINPVLTTGSAYASLTTGGYVNTDNPESSKIIVKIDSQHPSASNAFNSEERYYLLTWIQEGAQDN